jgi:tetratricopeptide (TPR) repeat protein
MIGLVAGNSGEMIIAELNSETVGRATGQMLVVALLVWGMVKCWSISRRPTTNTKCVRSLLLLLAGWLAAVLLQIGFKSASAGGRWVSVLMGLAVLGAVIGAIVLAVVGLVEYARKRDQYLQGRAQAIWALVLSGMFVVLFLGGALRSSQSRAALREKFKPGEAVIFADLNFQFVSPGWPWTPIDMSKLNPLSKVTFVRSGPEVYFTVVAEKLPDGELASVDYFDLVYARTKGIADSVELLDQQLTRVNGLEGVQVRLNAKVQGRPLQYLQWFCVTNGWAYQLMAWGKAENGSTIKSEGERLLQNFELLDFARRPELSGRGFGADFVSSNFHYRVNCSAADWLTWENLDTDCAYATFGVSHRRDAVLAVTALWLRDLPFTKDVLHRAVRDYMGLASNREFLENAQMIQVNDLEGIETHFTTASNSGGDLVWRLRLLHRGSYVFVIVGWLEAQNPGAAEWLADAVNRVVITLPENPTTDLAVLSEREKRAHRLAHNSIGLIFHREGQYSQATRHFAAAVSYGSDVSTPYLGNLVDSLVASGKYSEVLEVLAEHQDRVAVQPALRAQQAYLQGRQGEISLALTNYARLFAEGYSAEDHFREYINLLGSQEQWDTARSELEIFLRKNDSTDTRLLQAAVLKREKKFAEAVILLQKLREKNPYNASVAYGLGDAFIHAGQPNEALALTQEALKHNPDVANLWFLKGRAEFALKWYREAKESLSRASKNAPADADVKYFLDAVSAVLGEGVSAIVKEPIAPVVPPPELLELPALPETDFARDEGAYYQRHLTCVEFEPGKSLKQTDYVTIKTVTATGVSAFSTIQIAFQPLNEELFVNRLEVRDAVGTLISTGRVDDSYVLDDRRTTSATTRKILNIPISGLLPGCTIEMVSTRREIGQPKEFPFLPYSFSHSVPALEACLYFTGATGAVKFVAAPVLPPNVMSNGWYWRMRNPPQLRWEPLLPGVTDYIPMVWLSSATNSWAGVAVDYLDTVQDRLLLPDSQRELARSLTVGLTNASDKVAVIAAYVQTNYTYKAIEFGRRARVPQKLSDIVRNKYGDCKDHSVLAQQMLRAVGVPASLALVSSSVPVRRDLPSLDQFDHMLVHVSVGTNDLFVDCTTKNSNLAAPWTLGLAGREALVLDAVNSRFVRIPDYPTNASCIRVKRTVSIQKQTDITISERLTFTGVHAAYLRDYLRALPQTGRRTYVANQFVGAAGQLAELTFEGLEQPQSPLQVDFNYSMRGQFHTLEDQMVGSIPAGLEQAFLGVEMSERRLSPFEIAVPLIIDGNIKVNLPPGYKPRFEPGQPENHASRFLSFTSHAEATTDGWRITYQLGANAGRFPPNEYASYCQTVAQTVGRLKPRLNAERIGP